MLLTGHTGFKGAWLALWLHRLGAHTAALALPAETTPNLYTLANIGALVDEAIGDIRDPNAVERAVTSSNADIVLHLAAQALVRRSYVAPLETFGTNVLGTANVLDALRLSSVAKVAVFVTTDKVYRNQEWYHPYRESDQLGGHDPYSASKAASELVIDSYRASFLQDQGMAIASARAGNVVGGGDWSQDRLIPDAMRAWLSGARLSVRNPDSTRPWQHVLEPLSAYLRLVEHLWDRPADASAFNFGPDVSDSASVRSVVERMQVHIAGSNVDWGAGNLILKEASLLALDVSKARAALGIAPKWRVIDAIDRTTAWYLAFNAGKSARALCDSDIDDFEATACG